MNLEASHVEAHLTRHLGRPAQVVTMRALGDEPETGSERRQLKTYGYGQPILARYLAAIRAFLREQPPPLPIGPALR